MKRLTIIIMALVLAIGMVQCRKKVEQMTPCGGSVYVTLTAGCGAGAKTTITNTGLVYWSEGDKLYVVGSEDGYLGELTTMNYTDSNPSSIVTFGGTITEMTTIQDLHFYYPGRAGISVSRSAMEYTFDISTQDGTLDGIANTMHLMHGVKTGIEPGTTAFGEVNMANMIAIARLDISGYDAPVKCTAISSRTLDLQTGEWSGNGSTGNITLNNPTDPYYMVLIPGSQILTFKKNDSDPDPVVKTWLVESGKLYTDNGASIVINGGTSVIPVETEEWVNFNDQPGENFGVSGLPLWLKKNLGATCSTDFPANPLAATTWIGDYYAWGEVEPYAKKITFGYNPDDEWDPVYVESVEWCEHPKHDQTFTFDTSEEDGGYSAKNYSCDQYEEWNPAPYDDTGQLRYDANRGDAARAKLGGYWRMPTVEEVFNSISNTFIMVTNSYKGIEGLFGAMAFKVKDVADIGQMSMDGSVPSGKTYTVDDPHIFLPATGYMEGTEVFYLGNNGYYWANSLDIGNPANAYQLNFNTSDLSTKERYLGYTVRPVCDINPELFSGETDDFTWEQW